MASFRSRLSEFPARRTGRFIAVLAVALAAGHLAQTLAQRKAIPAALSALKSPVNIVQLSAAPEEAGLTAAVLAPADAHVPQPMPLNKPQAVVRRCAPALHLALAEGAMVAVSLIAPCDLGARVELHHAGLTLTERVASNGQMTARLPALDQAGRVEVRFADGRSVAAVRPMPELAHLRRFAVQWAGAQGFVLHGIENGAELGDKDDISPSQPGIIPAGDALGGWLSQLGDPNVDAPRLAQVYTYPLAGDADVVVQVPVTATSCGQALNGQTIRSEAGVAVATDLILAMPDCASVGEFLVLNNLAQNTKVAAR